MEAEFAEDEDAWISIALITGCINRDLEPTPEDYFLSDDPTGADLRQKLDH
jgi:hypothetical protein